MLTRQEIFTKVRDHLLKQGRRAEFANGTCAYRGVDGMSCAAGCLILDEFYTPDFEGALVDGLTMKSCMVNEALLNSGVPRDAIMLVRRLQMIHDGHFTEGWPAALRKLADEEGLVWE